MRDEQIQTKAIVSVAEMARMVRLSRARFYQLMKTGTFPKPIYDEETGRPYYAEDLQRVVLEVRRRNCGVDNRPVLFYARGPRPACPVQRPRATKWKPTKPAHPKLLEGLAALGLTTATAAQVDAALKAVYPHGVGEADQAELLRAVFLYLKRPN